MTDQPILTTRPLDVDNPPDGLTPQLGMRGVAIHWLPAGEGAVWSVQRVAFHSVSPSKADVPPSNVDEQVRYVRQAYALVAALHPVPSDAEIVYEVRW